ncbi:DUF4145 domain-containing protein [Frigidibacter sp. ROC022]|uniref:DUF4145 domain-containing protein n=1 Tax=Frigidibacter sp. ROC022 TaxID=2971796 RepID=UPI00215B64E4|nr:DUF4145 domain-containing protein [Frigidibacter sp. ROC022]MCR8725928.1 DUF4145 domain-containing protein [Frigidibacter sp. ROC022]
MKYVSPSVKETAFNCPHCGALARQSWYSTHADAMEKDTLPDIIAAEKLEELSLDHIEEAEVRGSLKKWAERKATGRPFFEEHSTYGERDHLNNVWISRCFNCSEVALWICDQMIYPRSGEASPANPDTPDDIRRDYDEASTILDLSARGAAALIRLGIQKLCKHLGQPGKSINDDIMVLVAGGLDPRIQKALDVVRVVGNNAVHPGQIDLKDDRATAESLFRLLNLIVEKMISEPKYVDEVYAALPEEARKAIEKGDGK